jgi:hypothetical protein
MATLKSIADALDARVESETLGLGIDCIRGYPAFGQQALSLPIASILFESEEPHVDKRVGKRTDSFVSTFVLSIYAANEVQLWSLLDAAKAMFRGWGQATIDSQSMQISPGRFQRVPFQLGITEEEKRFAVEGTVSFAYTH